MVKQSCGAILYAFDLNNNLGIILGEESRTLEYGWLPFKGGIKEGETPEQAAIREVYEETCGVVKLNEINLLHKFSTKRKEYLIGLCEVPYDTINRFQEKILTECREEFCEKKFMKFFKFPECLNDNTIHGISKASILFYQDKLNNLALDSKNLLRPRYLGINILVDVELFNNFGSSFNKTDLEKKKKPKLNLSNMEWRIEC